MKTPALALVAVAAALASCVENHVSVEMVKVCTHPKPETQGGGCLYPATCELGQLGRQFLYLDGTENAWGAALWIPIEFRNQLLDNSDPSAGRVNTNDAFIEEFRVSYEGVALTDAVYKIAGTVPTDGSAVLLVPVIPTNPTFLQLEAAGLGAEGVVLLAKVRAAGRYGDGSRFVTGEFIVPVDVYPSGYVPDGPCPTGEVLRVCPQQGQIHTMDCQAP